MPSITKTFDPKKWLNSFAGIPLTAYADGTFMKVTFDEDSFTKKTGASGEVVRVLNNNRGAAVEVTLMAHSAENDALSAIAAQDRIDGSGIGVFQGKELNGTSTVFGEGWIKKMPDLERAKEAGQVVWVFDLADAAVLIGGLLT